MRDFSNSHNTHFRILIATESKKSLALFRKLIFKTKKIQIKAEYTDILNFEKKYNKYTDIDVLLLDISNHEEHGIELVIKIKEIILNTPIVVVSTIDNDEISVNILKAGAQDYLVMDKLSNKSLLRSIRHAAERFRLIVKLEESRRLEHYLAYHDALTKLPNRQLFENRLNQAIAQANRESSSLAILFLDLDGFKDINDTMGHTCGDELLKIIARRLETVIRENETAARFGGDEFTIFLQNIGTVQDVIIVAERILEVFSKSIQINNKNFYITTSIGISIFPDDGKNVETLIKNADIAMYRAKSEGKHTYQFYNPSMNSNLSLRVKMVNDLRNALKRNQFIINYQPQINVRTGEITSIQSFINWIHPDLGIINDEKFIPVAIEKGLINSIAQWILYEVCSLNKKWQLGNMEKLRMYINLPVDILRNREIINTIKKILNETDLSPNYLGIEISENSSIHKSNDIELIKTLKELKTFGIQLSLDNFGTGYSSLYSLKNLPIDIIKIDKTFIKNITSSSEDIAIIRAIIAIAHILGLKVIAEGVQTEEQVLSLFNLGCDTIQGSYLCKPVSDIELARLIRKNLMTLIPEI